MIKASCLWEAGRDVNTTELNPWSPPTGGSREEEENGVGSGCSRTDPASTSPPALLAQPGRDEVFPRTAVSVSTCITSIPQTSSQYLLGHPQHYQSKTLALRLSSLSIFLIRLHCQLSFEHWLIISVQFSYPCCQLWFRAAPRSGTFHKASSVLPAVSARAVCQGAAARFVQPAAAHPQWATTNRAPSPGCTFWNRVFLSFCAVGHWNGSHKGRRDESEQKH